MCCPCWKTARLLFYHASASALAGVDQVQKRFQRELGLTEEAALVDFALAPLCARRDIAMLGMVHKAALGKCSSQLARFFKRAPPAASRTRLGTRAHRRQLYDPIGDLHLDTARRSALGLVGVYNALPSSIADLDDVPSFQSALQHLLRDRARRGDDNWQQLFSPRIPCYQGRF